VGAGFTAREQTLTDVTHEDGHAPFSFADREIGAGGFEFRYHDIWAPEIDPSEAASHGTNGKRATGQFLPITVGFAN